MKSNYNTLISYIFLTQEDPSAQDSLSSQSSLSENERSIGLEGSKSPPLQPLLEAHGLDMPDRTQSNGTGNTSPTYVTRQDSEATIVDSNESLLKRQNSQNGRFSVSTVKLSDPVDGRGAPSPVKVGGRFSVKPVVISTSNSGTPANSPPLASPVLVVSPPPSSLSSSPVPGSFKPNSDTFVKVLNEIKTSVPTIQSGLNVPVTASSGLLKEAEQTVPKRPPSPLEFKSDVHADVTSRLTEHQYVSASTQTKPTHPDELPVPFNVQVDHESVTKADLHIKPVKALIGHPLTVEVNRNSIENTFVVSAVVDKHPQPTESVRTTTVQSSIDEGLDNTVVSGSVPSHVSSPASSGTSSPIGKLGMTREPDFKSSEVPRQKSISEFDPLLGCSIAGAVLTTVVTATAIPAVAGSHLPGVATTAGVLPEGAGDHDGMSSTASQGSWSACSSRTGSPTHNLTPSGSFENIRQMVVSQNMSQGTVTTTDESVRQFYCFKHF